MKGLLNGFKVGSSNGGVDIEQTAAESPEKIFKVCVSLFDFRIDCSKIPLKITEPLSREDGLKMAHSLGFSHGTQDKVWRTLDVSHTHTHTQTHTHTHTQC